MDVTAIVRNAGRHAHLARCQECLTPGHADTCQDFGPADLLTVRAILGGLVESLSDQVIDLIWTGHLTATDQLLDEQFVPDATAPKAGELLAGWHRWWNGDAEGNPPGDLLTSTTAYLAAHAAREGRTVTWPKDL